VIGGLSSESKSLQEEGVPFLKNIPGLGGMFRNQSDRKTFSDTLIFITPHILPQARTAVELQGK
jgi:type IV pilus assembly protein PilQ